MSEELDDLDVTKFRRVMQAVHAGIDPIRIAELVGCAVKQVYASIAFTEQSKAEDAAWKTTLEAEKAKLKDNKP